MTGTDDPLAVYQLAYTDGTLPRVLDIIRIPLIGPDSNSYQPENWRIGAGNWTLVGRYGFDDLEYLLHQGTVLLHNRSDRVPVRMFVDHNVIGPSFALIRPESPEFYCRHRADGRKSLRCRFQYREHTYDLAVTDVCFDRVYRELIETRWIPDEDLYFTVSLGTPYEGHHYKLIAGIISDPAGELWNVLYR